MIVDIEKIAEDSKSVYAMKMIHKARDILAKVDFQKGDFRGAERQLANFAKVYTQLSIEEIDLLRGEFDSRLRLGYLRVSTSLLSKEIEDADLERKEKLIRIFFTMYSFENLEFGYDGLQDVSLVMPYLQNCKELAQKNWVEFEKVTTSEIARINLKKILFSESLET